MKKIAKYKKITITAITAALALYIIILPCLYSITFKSTVKTAIGIRVSEDQPGYFSVFKWESPDNTRVTLDGRNVPNKGLDVFCPMKTTTYKIVVYRWWGNFEQDITFFVDE